MDLLESVKRFLEDEDGENESTIDSLPAKFIEPIVGQGLKVDLVERGRLICSLKVPPRLVDDGNRLHGGAMATLLDLLSSTVFHTVELGTFHSGVSVEINISFVDVAVLGEEIEIDSKVLSVGKMICVASVELRKKETGKIIAQGRHTKYLGIGSNRKSSFANRYSLAHSAPHPRSSPDFTSLPELAGRPCYRSSPVVPATDHASNLLSLLRTNAG